MNGRLAALRHTLRDYASKKALFGYIEKHLFTRKDYRYRIIRDAYELCEQEFAGIKRESGEPYMTHLHAVMVIGVVHCGIQDYRIIAALVLHDLQEDFWVKWPTYHIAERYKRDIALIVDECTIIPHFYHFASEEEREAFYYRRIKKSHAVSPRLRGKMRRNRYGSIPVKLSDRIHNILTLGFVDSQTRRINKIRETERHLLSLARKYQILYKELSAALREANSLI